MIRRAEVATRAGTAISLRRRVAVVAFARSGAARVPAARVRLNAMTASTSQAALAVNTPDGRCANAEFFEVGVDLLDDRVLAVGLVRGDGVEDRGVGGGEEGVEAPHVEQGVLPRGLVLLGVEVRDPADHQPARHLVGLLLRGERGERHLGDLSTRDPAAGGLVEDGVGVLDRWSTCPGRWRRSPS